MKIINLVFLLLVLSSLVYAHETGEAHEEVPLERIGSPNDMNVISPIHYFSEGNFMLGVVFLGVWFFLLKGVYTLVILLLGRFFPDKE